MLFDDPDLKNKIILLLIVFIFAAEFVMLTGGLILKIKERYFYGRRTKEYLSVEYEEMLHREYPGWEISSKGKNIRKKELRKKCADCIQDLSQRLLYSAGTLTKTSGLNSVTVRIFVTVKPSYYRENARSADTREDTEYYTWLIFDVKPLYPEKFQMSGSFYADNFYPIPAAQNAVNSLGQYMSDKGKRKYDMTASVCGGVRLDNNVTVSYSGIRRDKWQSAVGSGLLNEISRLFSEWGSEMRLDYRKGMISLAAWIKMSDSEMYNGHNDFAANNSQMINFAAERLTDMAEIIESSK